ncbi:hypothetical protein Tco_1514360 [Tanacetum coccineum]
MEDTLRKFIRESARRHEENSNLIKEIRASIDAAIQNQGASIKTLEIQIRQMSKVLQERGFGSLPSSTKTNSRDQVKSISTTIEADSYPIRRIGSSQYAIWRMRIEQYVQMIDYALWKVIKNGATLPKTKIVEGVMTEMPITTTKEKA